MINNIQWDLTWIIFILLLIIFILEIGPMSTFDFILQSHYLICCTANRHPEETWFFFSHKINFLGLLIGDLVTYLPVTLNIMSDHIIGHTLRMKGRAINHYIKRTDGTGTVLGKPGRVVSLTIMNHTLYYIYMRLNLMLLTKPINQTCFLSSSNCRKAPAVYCTLLKWKIPRRNLEWPRK